MHVSVCSVRVIYALLCSCILYRASSLDLSAPLVDGVDDKGSAQLVEDIEERAKTR